AQELAGGRLAPEPPRNLVAAGVRRGGEIALEVERLEIVRAPADERRQRNVGGTLAHVVIIARREALEEARDVVEAFGGNAAQPEHGASAALRHPLLVPGAHCARFGGDVLRYVRGRGDRGRLPRRRRLHTRLRVVWEIAQDGPGRRAEQIERGSQHAVLERGVVRTTERVAEREGDEERARRLDL